MLQIVIILALLPAAFAVLNALLTGLIIGALLCLYVFGWKSVLILTGVAFAVWFGRGRTLSTAGDQLPAPTMVTPPAVANLAFRADSSTRWR